MRDVASGSAGTNVRVEGSNHPEFEQVREAFRRNFTEHNELGASVAVTRGGDLVVDLWGGWKDKARTQPWTRETRAPLWSGTKPITGICFAMIIDRGLATYEDCVSNYWPEFGAEGKESITIAQLLSHQAGLTGFRVPTTVTELLATDLAAGRLAAQAPFWPPGTACGYHGVTTGPIASTIFKRIEGRTIRQFVADEIARPFNLGMSIGLNPEDFHLAAEVVSPEDGFELGGLFGVAGSVSARKPRNPNLSPAQAAAMNPLIDGSYANLPEWRAADLPAANGFANAHSLAEFYALVLGHPRNGRRLGRPEVIAEATRVRVEGMDQVKSVFARWAAGFAVNEGLYGPHPNTFFHAGLGGTFSLGDPVADISVSYTLNRLGDLFERDPRRRSLITAVYNCLGSPPEVASLTRTSGRG
ncbi:MAG: Penicillin-binding protein beta-lactamase class [Gammaproteobacteria bacterium]|jgi:CubicO group peptidase (beta-lactamase class C family)|nr:Penicillin-binding protein beta-lactamase class [Gammaproteobacteria bacterium]